MDTKQWDPFFQNLAVYAYITGTKPLPEPDQNNIFIESYRYGWLWSIPLHTGRTSIGVVGDSQFGQEGILQNGAKAFLESQIALSCHTRGMLEDAQMDSDPNVVMDWSYTCLLYTSPSPRD